MACWTSRSPEHRHGDDADHRRAETGQGHVRTFGRYVASSGENAAINEADGNGTCAG